MLHVVAQQALIQFDIQASAIESVNHEFNSTFKVVATSGEVFALRINVNSDRSIENLRAEVTWVQSITEVDTPKPIRSTSGEYFVVIESDKAKRSFACVLYTWLDGQEIGDEPSEEQLFALGQAMARMHLAKRTELPKGSLLPVLDDVLWHLPDVLLSEDAGLSPEAQKLIQVAYKRIDAFLKRLYASGQPQLIHADLHGWNVMWSDAGIALFDFDDCAVGYPIQDLFTTLYYLDSEEQEASVLRGYQSVLPVPAFSADEKQLLLLQRRLVLNNSLLHSTNVEWREMFPRYTIETLRRIRDWLNKESSRGS